MFPLITAVLLVPTLATCFYLGYWWGNGRMARLSSRPTSKEVFWTRQGDVCIRVYDERPHSPRKVSVLMLTGRAQGYERTYHRKDLRHYGASVVGLRWTSEPPSQEEPS